MFFEKLRRFMYGRYGGDKFNLFLLIAGLILSIIAQFTGFFPLIFVAYAIYIYAIFRIFSKNLAARQKEYYSFLKLWTPIEKWFKLKTVAFRQRKEFKYFHCPNCHQPLRAPRGRGKIQVTCQRCHKQFNQKT